MAVNKPKNESSRLSSIYVGNCNFRSIGMNHRGRLSSEDVCQNVSVPLPNESPLDWSHYPKFGSELPSSLICSSDWLFSSIIHQLIPSGVEFLGRKREDSSPIRRRLQRQQKPPPLEFCQRTRRLPKKVRSDPCLNE